MFKIRVIYPKFNLTNIRSICLNRKNRSNCVNTIYTINATQNHSKIINNKNEFNLISNLNSFEKSSYYAFINNSINYFKNSLKLNDPEKNKQQTDSQNQENKTANNENNNNNKGREWIMMIGATIFIWMLFNEYVNRNIISWNFFYNEMLLKGEVESVTVIPFSDKVMVQLHRDAIVKGRRSPADHYFISIPASEFEEKLKKAEDELKIPLDKRLNVRYQSTWLSQLVGVGLLALLLYFIYRGVKSANLKSSLGGPMDLFSQFTKARFTMVDPSLKANVPTVTFKDVAGLKEAKIEVMEFVHYLKSPERFKALGAKVPKGALLLGPPGCGKTLLAKALAAEAGVPFFNMAGTEFIEVIGGVGAARVRDLFKEARKHSPSIIFIDEIDAIGKKRSNDAGGSNAEGDQTLNQLLSEMDGLETKVNVIVLASTNRPDILDKALLRPGRFDRHISIDLPTYEERKEILNVHLSKLKLSNQIDERFISDLAHLTTRMSGADLSNVCNEAALIAARNAKTEIDRSSFEKALERVLSGSEKKTSSIAKDEQKFIAYHECGHLLLSWLLENGDLMYKVSLVPRTKALSSTHYLPDDKKLHSKEELFDIMVLRFGGKVAESIVFNTSTTNTENDLKPITRLAYAQIQSFGMNETVGQISFPTYDEQRQQGGVGAKPYSKKLQRMIDEEAQRLIAKAHQKAENLIKENIDKLHKLASELIKKETLNYQDIVDLIGPPINQKKIKIDLAKN